MGWWRSACYDAVMGPLEARALAQWRAELLATLSGRVLEVGAGTGANLPHYGPSVTKLVLTEPDGGMRARLAERAAGLPWATDIQEADVQALPFADESFDAAVATLVFCSVPAPAAGLAELHRVLRPGGRLVFIEHVAAPHGTWARTLQGAVEPLWKRVADGCHLTRATAQAIGEAGFSFEVLREVSLPVAPALFRPAISGVARKPRG